MNDSNTSLTSGLRIVFFGTPAFASHILEELCAAGEQVVAVVTTAEKQQGRGLKTKPMAMHESAKRLGIPVLSPSVLKDQNFIAELRSYQADIFCVVAYKILPREIFTMPRLGTFNVHTSLLPKYRGAAPMNWAIINGEKETGVTTFLLDDKVDTGNILLQESVEIGDEENVGELHDALMNLGANLALKTIRGLATATLTPIPQPPSGASPAPKIFPEDCILDFSQTAIQIHNKIRGLSPYPTATSVLPGGERLKIFQARIAADASPLPQGSYKVAENGKRLLVGTSSVPIELLEVQRENKKRMPILEFLRGAQNIFS